MLEIYHSQGILGHARAHTHTAKEGGRYGTVLFSYFTVLMYQNMRTTVYHIQFYKLCIYKSDFIWHFILNIF